MTLLGILEKITDLAAAIAVVLIVPLIGAMVYEVVARYVFSAPTSWAYEVSYMLMATIFLLGVGYALKMRQHVSVDIIDGFISRRTRAVIDVFGFCLLLPCVAWITWQLGVNALRAFQSGEVTGQSSWNPVIWPYRTACAFGFAVFATQIVAEILKSLAVAFGAEAKGSAAR